MRAQVWLSICFTSFAVFFGINSLMLGVLGLPSYTLAFSVVAQLVLTSWALTAANNRLL